MYELYVSETCPYSIKVMEYFKAKDIPFKKKLIEDYANLEELINLGGMQQVPFLHDTAAGIKMYESDDIIEYAGKNK